MILSFHFFSLLLLFSVSERLNCYYAKDLVGTYWFWAPEVYRYNGQYYLFYSTEEKLAVAVADSPEGPFVKTSDDFLLHVRAIDGHVLFDDDGRIYLYYSGKSTQGKNKNGIWGCELNPDLCSIKPETMTELSIPEGWEGATNEGPYMLKHNGVYYLTYSGEGYGSPNYSVGVMTSTFPLGAFVRNQQNPILHADNFLMGTGHHCFTTSPDHSELWIVYHSHCSTTQVEPRPLCIDRAAFVKNESGPDRLMIYGPTVTPQSVPSR